ncbi:MAG: hypothetical protein U1F25_01610 [Rubrivivax sp.]
MARALMAQPRLLLLDEPSLGLSPLIVDELFSAIARSITASYSRCCWWSRTSPRRCAWPTAPMCSKKGASRPRARPMN